MSLADFFHYRHIFLKHQVIVNSYKAIPVAYGFGGIPDDTKKEGDITPDDLFKDDESE